jgi:hypothetical protein
VYTFRPSSVLTVCTRGSAAFHRVHSLLQTGAYRVHKQLISVHGTGSPVPVSAHGGGVFRRVHFPSQTGSYRVHSRRGARPPCAPSVRERSLQGTQTAKKHAFALGLTGPDGLGSKPEGPGMGPSSDVPTYPQLLHAYALSLGHVAFHEVTDTLHVSSTFRACDTPLSPSLPTAPHGHLFPSSRRYPLPISVNVTSFYYLF